MNKCVAVRDETCHAPGEATEIVFVGALYPESLGETSPACYVSGNKFQLNLLRSLEGASGNGISAVAMRPVAMYPLDSRIIFGTESFAVSEKTRVLLVPMINLRVAKQVSVAVATFWHLVNRLGARSRRRSVVICYNVFSPLALPVLAAAKVCGAKSIAVVADLPFDVYSFSGPWGWLERADFYTQLRSLRLFDGIVGLTEYIAKDFAPGRPSMVMEGAINEEDVENERSTTSRDEAEGNSECVYTGALSRINGIEFLIDAFAHIPDDLYRLVIIGRGELEGFVRAAAAADSRITYVGAVSSAEARRRQRRATVLINPRPSHRTITRYTFPSKLLEYMTSGRPVISTKLQGVPPEYEEYLHVLSDETSEGMAQLIQWVCNRPRAELADEGRRAKRFVLRNKTWAAQGTRIMDFVATL